MMRSSLLFKYAVFFVALVSVSLIASALVGLHFTYQESKRARLSLQREKAHAAAARIESFVKNMERAIGWLRVPRIDPAQFEALQFDYQRLLRLEPAITDLRLLDRNGREQLFVSRIQMNAIASGADYSADPRFMHAVARAGYFSSITFRDGTEPYMSISVSSLTPEGGITIADVNLKFVHDVINAIKLSPKGETYIVERSGHLIAHPDMNLVLRKTDFSPLAQVKASLNAASAPEAPGVMVARNHAGREVLAASAPIDVLDWRVVVEEPLEEAFAPLWASLFRTGLLLLAGLAISILLGLLFARQMITPIRALQRGVARIAAGDLDQRIDIKTGDELEVLATGFNEMAFRLRESYGSLEREVETRTHQLRAALDVQTHTSEVLKTISRQRFDLERVLHEVVSSIVKLGNADAAGLFVRQPDGRYVLAAGHSDQIDIEEFINRNRDNLRPEPGSASEQAVATRKPFQIEDIRTEAAYPWQDTGYRTVLAVPVLRETDPVGVVIAARKSVRKFDNADIDVVTTFADQAGIAIETHRLFEEIQNKGRALELANRHKSEFLANVSHELRTPLNAIIGFSEGLRDGIFGSVSDAQAEYLDDIHASGRHLLTLINDILNLSKIEAGRMELELETFDLDEALRSSVNVIRAHANTNGITVLLEGDAKVGDWIADARLFRQVMLNLLSNAIKYTPRGGTVTVTTARMPGLLRVSVSDTGRGIAHADRETIFEPFHRVRVAGPENIEGTGLGLALTRKFVELHGGHISVESALGVGSNFTITLPEMPRQPS